MNLQANTCKVSGTKHKMLILIPFFYGQKKVHIVPVTGTQTETKPIYFRFSQQMANWNATRIHITNGYDVHGQKIATSQHMAMCW